MPQLLMIDEILVQGRQPTREEILALLPPGATLPTEEEIQEAIAVADQFIAEHCSSGQPTPLEMLTIYINI